MPRSAPSLGTRGRARRAPGSTQLASLLGRATAGRTRLLDSTALRRAAPGRTRRRSRGRDREGVCQSSRHDSAGGHDLWQSRDCRTVALTEGPAGLSRFVIQVFRPVQPMLAESAESVGEAMADLGKAMLEFKLDGARIQVHKQGREVRVFSRNLRDVTAAVPEVVEAIERSLTARSRSLTAKCSRSTRRQAVAFSGDDAAVWPETRR